jgi:hypothetical protein
VGSGPSGAKSPTTDSVINSMHLEFVFAPYRKEPTSITY